MNSQTVLITAAAIADGSGLLTRPGAILLRRGRIVASGTPQFIGVPAGTAQIMRPDSLVIPGLVNAHCHLDLTHIGPIPYPGAFVTWIEAVRTRRADSDQAVRNSVERGAELSRAGGTGLIGDIAGARSAVPVDALRATGLSGVSYVEMFGLGRSQLAAIEWLREIAATCPHDDRGVKLGLQPHSPYSCGLDVFAGAAAIGLPMATHLAETPEELQFVESADGPLAEMLARLGVLDDTVIGHGGHPIDHLADVLATTPFLAAHVNYLEPQHVQQLAGWPISVAYCPRASAYFGHPQHGAPPHQYLDMLNRGLNVALGTDSILCLGRADRISVLDEMRFLHARDGVDPALLLRMATVNGARALGFDPLSVTLAPGSSLNSGLIALPIGHSRETNPVIQILHNDDAPNWIIDHCGEDETISCGANRPTACSGAIEHGRFVP